MKTKLLDDILTDETYADFRGELQSRFRKEVRRRRWTNNATRLAIAASLAIIATFTFWPNKKETHVPSIAAVSVKPNVDVLRTSALHAHEFLVIAPQLEIATIETRPMPELAFTTDRTKSFPSISDSELLAFFPNRPTGLLAARGGKRLLFLDPADASRFMSSN